MLCQKGESIGEGQVAGEEQHCSCRWTSAQTIVSLARPHWQVDVSSWPSGGLQGCGCNE